MNGKERMIRNTGRGQTISQQYIAAYMAQSLDLHPDDNVPEVGSRCGNNAALLSKLVSHVYSPKQIYQM